jgi:hypothetical protein
VDPGCVVNYSVTCIAIFYLDIYLNNQESKRLATELLYARSVCRLLPVGCSIAPVVANDACNRVHVGEFYESVYLFRVTVLARSESSTGRIQSVRCITSSYYALSSLTYIQNAYNCSYDSGVC